MLTVERNVKFHSSQTAADLCIVENVILNEDHHEDIKLSGSIFALFSLVFLFYR